MTSEANTIKVAQGNGPLLTFQGKTKLADGSLVPYILSGAPTIKMYIKTTRDDADSAALTTYQGASIVITADGTTAGAKYSEFTVQINEVDGFVNAPGGYYFHVDVIKGGHPDTIKKGYLVVENT